VNFALSDEQELLTEAARGALSRVKTIEAAREALDGDPLPDLWPTAVEAGWPGLMVAEERGGAGLGAMDAMLVFSELGRVLAGVPLLGHLPGTLLLDGALYEGIEPFATGESRVAFAAAKPPSAVEPAWTVDPVGGLRRASAPEIGDGTVTGEVAWVPDAPGAGAIVVVGAEGRVALVQAGDCEVESLEGYDATRSLGHVRFSGAPAEVLDVTVEAAATAWYLAQALLAAEAVGAIERALEMSVA
jgi:alkylation response protein AidB-like acyl-CoA dehydrogenase